MLKKVPVDVRVFAQVVADLPINVIICDRKKFRITYMNEASRRTLERIEHLLPCPADAGRLPGQSMGPYEGTNKRSTEHRYREDPYTKV